MPIDSDGKRRIFGEAIYESRGDLLRMMGRDINDPENILPAEEDHNQRLQESIAAQKLRHAALEAELCAKHGQIFVWPYHIFGDPVWNGPNGLWLIRSMNLLPGDPWNILYLASNRESSSKIGLPMHPGGGISFVDDAIQNQIKKFRLIFDDLLDATDPFQTDPYDSALLAMFVDRKKCIHNDLLAYAARLREQLLGMLWEATRKTA